MHVCLVDWIGEIAVEEAGEKLLLDGRRKERGYYEKTYRRVRTGYEESDDFEAMITLLFLIDWT